MVKPSSRLTTTSTGWERSSTLLACLMLAMVDASCGPQACRLSSNEQLVQVMVEPMAARDGSSEGTRRHRGETRPTTDDGRPPDQRATAEPMCGCGRAAAKPRCSVLFSGSGATPDAAGRLRAAAPRATSQLQRRPTLRADRVVSGLREPL